MKLTFALVCVAVLAVATAQAGVVEIDKDNFDTTLKESPMALVMFTAPWCDVCDGLKKDMEKASEALKHLEPPVLFGYCDLDKDKDFKERLGVQGAPQFSLYRYGTRSNYRGKREADDIIHYVPLLHGPSVRRVTKAADLEQYLNNPRVLHYVVGFFPNENADLQTYNDLSNALREDFIFYAVVASDKPEASIYSKWKVDAKATVPTIVVYKSWDTANPARNTLAAGATREQMEKFIRDHSYPDVPTADTTWTKFINGRNVSIARFVLRVDEKKANLDDPAVKPVVDLIRKLKDNPLWKDKLTLAVAARSQNEHLANQFGLEKADAFLFINKFGEKDRYVYEGNFDESSVTEFLTNWVNKKARNFLKSGPAIPPHDSGVIDVIGKTFYEVTDNPEKDVLMEFYAPWCGHCKKLAPIWEDLARRYKDMPSVTIARMDATANEWDKEQFPVSGYPTIYWIPGGRWRGRTEKYKYARDLDTFTQFIETMSGVPHKAPADYVPKKRDEL